MSLTTCNFHTIVLVIVIILIIAFSEEVFQYAPILTKLFTDPINFMLVIALVVLVLLIDLPCGILLSFLVLYLAVYVKRMVKNKLDRFENIVIASKLLNNDNTTKIVSDIPTKYLSESEINYNNTASFANNNLPPFQPVVQDVVDTQTQNIISNISLNQNDSITVVDSPNRDGYDIIGCRYDFKDSKQNMTKYGPPLSSCGVYNPEQVKQYGTLFYPLNA
jgi:hypothetical protein